MCGILGLVVNHSNGGQYKELTAFEHLLYFDAVRGRDSTGVGMFTNEAGGRVIKSAADAQAFINTKEWDEVGSEFISKGKALLGHNRKKTVGTISDTTAHPFVVDNRYIFIHNGTLYSHKHLADTEVDSEALGIHLTKCKTKEELEEALEDVYGAYACAWLDVEQEKMRILRNKERPLYMGQYDGGWAFCSEMGLLRTAFAREEIVFKDVQEVPVDCLVEFNLTQNPVVPITTALTIKKYTTTAQHTPSSSGQATNGVVVTTNGQLSKNAYKKVVKQNLVGKEVVFKIVDYVERFPDKKPCDEFCIMGETTELPFNHILHFNLKKITEELITEFYMDMPWKGTITMMVYNPKTKHVDVHINDPLPMFTSVH